MGARTFRRILGIAMIAEDFQGNLHVVGSKDVQSHSIEMYTPPLDFDRLSNSRYEPNTFHIEADCNSLTWQYRAEAAPLSQIAQRGIYLPDMSFRALPGGDK